MTRSQPAGRHLQRGGSPSAPLFPPPRQACGCLAMVPAAGTAHASRLRPGAWSNRFAAVSSLAARGSFRSGDAESPDPGPADPQPRHEGGDRRVHLGERLGGGLLRGRGGQRRPARVSPPASAAQMALAGLAPCLTRSLAVPPPLRVPRDPAAVLGQGASPSPLPEELQRLGAHEGSPGSPLHQLLPDHSTWRKTCLAV